jgi:hypothetical protein
MTGGTASGQREFPSFPPPAAPSFDFTQRPERITPLAAAIENANRHALNLMKGKANG